MSLKELIEIAKNYLSKTTTNDVEIKVLTSLLAILFGNDLILSVLVMLLIVIDFITGIIKAMVKKENIESHKFRKTVLKIYVYYSLIITLGIVDYMTKLNIFSRIGYAFVALTEGKSIVENLILIYPPIENIKEKLKWWKSNGNSSKTSQS